MPQVEVTDSWTEVIARKRRKLLILHNPNDTQAINIALNGADADDGITLVAGEKLRLEITAMDRDAASVSVWAKHADTGNQHDLDYIERP